MNAVSSSSTLRSLRHVAPVASRCFSSTTQCASNRRVLVELLQDIEGLGLQGQRVNVRPGRARISLVPQGQARLVPFAKQLKLKPSSEEKRIKSSTLGNLSGLAISS